MQQDQQEAKSRLEELGYTVSYNTKSGSLRVEIQMPKKVDLKLPYRSGRHIR